MGNKQGSQIAPDNEALQSEASGLRRFPIVISLARQHLLGDEADIAANLIFDGESQGL